MAAAVALVGARGALGFVEELLDDGSADNPVFWDRTYRRQSQNGRDSYEWYGLGFQQLRVPLEGVLPRDAGVLVVGSGDSTLSADLAAEGWRVTSLDFSAEVTSYMRRMHPGLDFVTQDARNMSFEDGRFGAIVDKGLSDCIGSASKRRSYFAELRRVLRTPGGALAVVAQRPLEARRDLGPGWRCEPRRELYGPLFVEDSPDEPPKPQPGTEGQIPYYLLVCQSEALTAEAVALAEEAEEEEEDAEDQEGDSEEETLGD